MLANDQTTENQRLRQELVGAPLHSVATPPRNLHQTLENAATRNDKGILFHLDRGLRFLGYRTLMNIALSLLAKLDHEPRFKESVAILPIGLSLDNFTVAVWTGFLGNRTVIPLATPKTYDSSDMDASVFAKVCNAYEKICILTSSQHVSSVRKIANNHLIVPIDTSDLGNHSSGRPVNLAERPAIMYATSGSTGSPKGILHSEDSLLLSSQSFGIFLEMNEQSFALNWLPLTHSFGMTCHLRDVYLGCNQIISEPRRIVGQPQEFLDLVNSHRVNVTLGSSYLLKELITISQTADLSLLDLSCLKYIVCGAESIQGKMVRDLVDAFASCQLSRNVVANCYGTTETLGISGCLNTEQFLDKSILPVGKPYPGVAIRLVSPTTHVFDQSEGDIEVKNPFSAKSYLDVDNGCIKKIENDGWFETGDVGFVSDDNMFLVGRTKEMISVRGKHFPPQTVERLIEEMEFVVPGFTVVFSVAADGQPEESLVVIYVPRMHHSTNRAEQESQIGSAVSKFCGTRPSRVLALRQEDIPKNNLGKISRANLRIMYLGNMLQDATRNNLVINLSHANANVLQQENSEASHLNVSTSHGAKGAALFDDFALADRLKVLWKQLLKATDISDLDDFFFLGGDSLSALQMLGQARRYGINSTLEQFYTAPTIRSLVSSKSFEARQSSPMPDVQQIIPLTPTQCKIAFTYTDLKSISEATYLEFKSSVPKTKMLDAINRLLETHESLRASFTYSTSYWEQKIMNVALDKVVSFADFAFEEIEADTLQKSYTKMAELIDVSTGRLCHFKLIVNSDGKVKSAIFLIHKLACDYFSMRILLEDFAQLIGENDDQYVRPQTSFSSWSTAQANLLTTDVFLRETTFWQNIQVLSKEMPKLPTDFRAGSMTYMPPQYLAKKVTELEVGRLRPQELEKSLIIALSKTFSQWLDCQWIELAVLSHGRNSPDVQGDPTRVVGNLSCASRLVLDTQLPKDELNEEIQNSIIKGRNYELLLWADKILMKEFDHQLAPFRPQICLNILGSRDFLSNPTWPFTTKHFGSLGDQSQDINTPELTLSVYLDRHNFEFVWEYQPHFYKVETIEMLHKVFIEFFTVAES